MILSRQFSVDPALECTASGLDLAEFSVGGGRSADWSERVYRGADKFLDLPTSRCRLFDG